MVAEAAADHMVVDHKAAVRKAVVRKAVVRMATGPVDPYHRLAAASMEELGSHLVDQFE